MYGHARVDGIVCVPLRASSCVRTRRKVTQVLGASTFGCWGRRQTDAYSVLLYYELSVRITTTMRMCVLNQFVIVVVVFVVVAVAVVGGRLFGVAYGVEIA